MLNGNTLDLLYFATNSCKSFMSVDYIMYNFLLFVDLAVDGHGDGSLDVKQENEGDGSLLSKEAAATPLPRYNLRGRNRLENASKAELTIEKSMIIYIYIFRQFYF